MLCWLASAEPVQVRACCGGLQRCRPLQGPSLPGGIMAVNACSHSFCPIPLTHQISPKPLSQLPMADTPSLPCTSCQAAPMCIKIQGDALKPSFCMLLYTQSGSHVGHPGTHCRQFSQTIAVPKAAPAANSHTPLSVGSDGRRMLLCRRLIALAGKPAASAAAARKAVSSALSREERACRLAMPLQSLSPSPCRPCSCSSWRWSTNFGHAVLH